MGEKLSEAEELAVEVLAVIDARRSKYDGVNEQATVLMGDFATHLQYIDEEICEAVMALVRTALGHGDLADYYLHECVGKYGHGGKIICCDEADPWQLRSADDLKSYLLHAKTCPGLKSRTALTGEES